MTKPRRASRIVLAALAFTAVAADEACAGRLRVERLDVLTTAGVHHFKVEVADTPATQERGLMFRKSLAADRGMLFDFGSEQPVSFWMKNTLIPLDMLFIGADGRIVSIARNATPRSETPIASAGPVRDVLELRGGRAAEIGAAPGDRVREEPNHR